MRVTTGRMRRGAVSCVVLLCLVTGVTACGVAADDGPKAIQAEDLPPDLLDPNPPTSTTISGSPTTAVTVYLLVRTGTTTRLAPAEREASDATSRGERIAVLLAPRSTEEQEQGLESSIPSDTVLLDVEYVEESNELVVNLSGALFDVQGEELANAFAQLVWTVTELDGVRQVRFRVDGEEYRAPDAEGIEQEGAVTRGDYSQLAPT
ncbi:MAG: GerMN domain-containing protein [Acidimicrobiales bacterium]